MPLYEYRCRKCGARIERIQKFTDPPLETCESCGGELERLISSPAIQFKGSGWYVTDYARKSSTPAAAPSSESKPATTSANETKKPSEQAPAKPSTETKS
ncbi:MAG: FmdB family zinc ribbon protein [Terriglobia bacterium]